ncbi:hypothetical protein Anapl_07863 [Anas platyrhynchos]|uniref:Uncharacterized protein n=1 Tax=Anas platyrhynchos TaxID=8839 RepID=R0KMZ2_ANAPL|nr:hypothetical protein Anapl_07863 [Anas platyrhynchos]
MLAGAGGVRGAAALALALARLRLSLASVGIPFADNGLTPDLVSRRFGGTETFSYNLCEGLKQPLHWHTAFSQVGADGKNLWDHQGSQLPFQPHTRRAFPIQALQKWLCFLTPTVCCHHSVALPEAALPEAATSALSDMVCTCSV